MPQPQRLKKSRNPRGRLEEEKYRAELTSGQLVIGICILMLFGLTCFLLGVLIGKFEVASRPEMAAQPSPAIPTSVVSLPPVQSVEVPAPSPAPVIASPKPAPKPVLQPSVTRPKSPIVETRKPRPKPVVKAPEPKPPPLIALEPQDSGTTLSVPPPTTVGAFTIQLGAYSKRENALKTKQEVEKKAGYAARFVDSPGGKLVIVQAGEFQDRVQAETARERLQNDFGFTGCIIKQIK